MDTIIIPRAYLYTDVAEHVIVLLKLRLAELMDLMDPKLYRKYVTTDRNGQEMLYVKLQKALYGLLRVVFLLYRKLLMDLEKYGLILIP